MHYPFEPVSSFWRKVDRSGGPDACWPWLAAQDTNGYGAVKWEGRKINAHRKALELHIGRMLLDGMYACHICNNPICCNPDHLYEGTPSQNAQDMVAAGNHHRWSGQISRHGESSYVAKITSDVALDIFRRALSGENYKQIALSYAEFGVTRNTVKDIKNGRSWTSVTGLPYLGRRQY